MDKNHIGGKMVTFNQETWLSAALRAVVAGFILFFVYLPIITWLGILQLINRWRNHPHVVDCGGRDDEGPFV